jgi:tetratricopeptide (TPR) repeat protein
MNNDAEKIKLFKEVLQTQVYSRSFEAVSLALSIQDDEDRDLYLLDTVHWVIKNKNWQQAYGAAQLMSESYEKSEALQAVADYLASIGHLEKAFSIYTEAEKSSLAENISEWQQAVLLHKIAKSLYKIKAVFKAGELWDKAVAIARKGEDSSSSQDSMDSSSVLAEIAENFAAEERFKEALSISQKIKNIEKKERVLRRISDYSQQIKQVA